MQSFYRIGNGAGREERYDFIVLILCFIKLFKYTYKQVELV